jgi:ABC-type multidrug transport system ATPase subunit
MTGRELLDFHGQLHGLPAAARAGRIKTLLAQVDLADAADRPVGTYSKGMQQRLGTRPGAHPSAQTRLSR